MRIRANRPPVYILGILATATAGPWACGRAPGREGARAGSPGPPPTRTSSPATIRFVDVTKRAGIHFRHQNSKTDKKHLVETMGSGCAFLDYDGDGRQDLLFLNNAPLPGVSLSPVPFLALYHNDGGGKFTDRTRAAGLDRELSYAMGAAVGDYDNDGREDVYVSCVLGPGRLYHNEGGRFRETAREAGVTNDGKWSSSCAWIDYDRDGRIDLFVCSYVRYRSLSDDLPCFASGTRRIYCIPSAYEMTACTLYHNEGAGRFRDVTSESGVGAAKGKALGVAVWDFDQDGWPDLFVANDTVAGFLFHNKRNGTFREVGTEAGVAYDEEGNPHSGMGIDAADLFNDGKTWLAITNFQGQETSLYRQVAAEMFVDERQSSGIGAESRSVLGFGALFCDFDNDGLQDLAQVDGHVQDDIQERERHTRYAQPALLFQNRGNGILAEVGRRGGPPFSSPMVARGFAWGDMDDDGRPDLAVTTNNGPAYLWQNRTSPAGHWLTLRLAGRRSNRSGIGAMIEVRAGGVTQRRMVRSGSSYLSQSDLRAHFGLGASNRAAIEVRWPSGTVDRISTATADAVRTLVEGEGALR